eukprot:scaffold43303_cov19-Tisochrysis_lutea.AAC.3
MKEHGPMPFTAWFTGCIVPSIMPSERGSGQADFSTEAVVLIVRELGQQKLRAQETRCKYSQVQVQNSVGHSNVFNTEGNRPA